VRGNKRARLDIEDRTLEQHLALEAQIQADCIRSSDFKEGSTPSGRSARPSSKGSR